MGVWDDVYEIIVFVYHEALCGRGLFHFMMEENSHSMDSNGIRSLESLHDL